MAPPLVVGKPVPWGDALPGSRRDHPAVGKHYTARMLPLKRSAPVDAHVGDPQPRTGGVQLPARGTLGCRPGALGLCSGPRLAVM